MLKSMHLKITRLINKPVTYPHAYMIPYLTKLSQLSQATAVSGAAAAASVVAGPGAITAAVGVGGTFLAETAKSLLKSWANSGTIVQRNIRPLLHLMCFLNP
jgi:hypothetical protein